MDPTEIERPVFASKPDCATKVCGQYYVCSDCRPEEWRHVEYAEEWYELGLTPAEALEWAMDPMDVEGWMAAGIGAHEAHEFDDLALEAVDARQWRALGADGFALAKACSRLSLEGFDSDAALEALIPWVKAGFSVCDKAVWLFIAAGVGPRERQDWYKEALELMAGLLRPSRLASRVPTLRR